MRNVNVVLILSVGLLLPGVLRPQVRSPTSVISGEVVASTNRAGGFQRAIFGPRQEIIALDPSAGQIAVFDSRGQFQKMVDVPGTDVGTFSSPAAIGWHRGSLWIFDLSQNRIAYADRSFNIIRVESLPYFKWPIETFLVVRGITATGDVWLEEGSSPNGFERMSANGRVILQLRTNPPVVDTAVRLPFQDAVFLLRFSNHAAMMRAQPWAPVPLFGVSPNGTHAVVVRQALGSDTIVVQRWSANDSRWVDHTIVSKSISLTEKDVNSLITEFLNSDLVARFEDRSAARRAVREALFIPQYHPQFLRMFVGSDGTVWLLRSNTKNSQSWLAISSDGKTQRRVQIPGDIQLEDADLGSGSAIGLRAAGSDQTTIVLLRIQN